MQEVSSAAETSATETVGPLGDANPDPDFDSDGSQGTVHVLMGAAWSRIVLSGEIDASLAADFSEAIADTTEIGMPIEVDAHHVTFMDSSGVAFLARLTTQSPHRVRVLRAPATMRFLLDVTRIGELLDVLDEDPGFEMAPIDEFTIERISHKESGTPED